LRKAIEMDAAYGEAFYVLGLIHRRTGQENLAREAFERAGAVEVSQLTKSVGKRRQAHNDEGVAPLFQISASNSRRLITGGDRRLAEALRQDALSAFTAAGSDHR
jgi:hypothetical protein